MLALSRLAHRGAATNNAGAGQKKRCTAWELGNGRLKGLRCAAFDFEIHLDPGAALPCFRSAAIVCPPHRSVTVRTKQRASRPGLFLHSNTRTTFFPLFLPAAILVFFLLALHHPSFLFPSISRLEIFYHVVPSFIHRCCQRYTQRRTQRCCQRPCCRVGTAPPHAGCGGWRASRRSARPLPS